jgi:hypothetical protein
MFHIPAHTCKYLHIVTYLHIATHTEYHSDVVILQDTYIDGSYFLTYLPYRQDH